MVFGVIGELSLISPKNATSLATDNVTRIATHYHPAKFVLEERDPNRKGLTHSTFYNQSIRKGVHVP